MNTVTLFDFRFWCKEILFNAFDLKETLLRRVLVVSKKYLNRIRQAFHHSHNRDFPIPYAGTPSDYFLSQNMTRYSATCCHLAFHILCPKSHEVHSSNPASDTQLERRSWSTACYIWIARFRCGRFPRGLPRTTFHPLSSLENNQNLGREVQHIGT